MPTSSSPGYPPELECDRSTVDGITVHLRPICPDDAEPLEEFHRHLSPETVHRRFFSAHPILRPQEVEWFTHVDYERRLALVAEIDGELVAVGRYDRSGNEPEAEVAFVVADRYQHHGIGTLLLEELAAAAWDRDITEFVAQTLSENNAMLRVFFDSGFPVRSAAGGGTVSVRFPIEPTEAYRAARQARHALGGAAQDGEGAGEEKN
jgi:GNAT superfamily N-acetyltransferase